MVNLNLHTLSSTSARVFSRCVSARSIEPIYLHWSLPRYLPPSLVYLIGYGPSLDQLAYQSCPIGSLAVMVTASTILFTNLLLATAALAQPSLEHRLAQRGGDAHIARSFQPVGGPKAFDNRADASSYWSGAVLSVRAIFPMMWFNILKFKALNMDYPFFSRARITMSLPQSAYRPSRVQADLLVHTMLLSS